MQGSAQASLPNQVLFVHAKPPLRLVGVVRATAELQVVGARLAAICERDEVVILEEAALGASTTSSANERALPAVARPDSRFTAAGM